MNQSEDFGKILKPWPNLVDHFSNPYSKISCYSAEIIIDFCNSNLVDWHQSEILKLSKLRLNALVKKSWGFTPHPTKEDCSSYPP